MRNKKYYRLINLALSLILGITAFILSYQQVFNTADQYFTNWLYERLSIISADQRITIIAIDEDSIKEYGDYSTWSRSLLANAITRLNSDHACVIGLDVPLWESNSEDTDGDASLIEACEAAGNVVAIAAISYDGTPDSERNDNTNLNSMPEYETDAVSPTQESSALQNNTPAHGLINEAESEPANKPQPDTWQSLSPMKDSSGLSTHITDITFPFNPLSSYVHVGIVNATQTGADGQIRNAATTVHFNGTDYSSFPALVYSTYQTQNNEKCTYPDVDEQSMFRFHTINESDSYQIISLKDLLNGNYNADDIKDNIVLIGNCTADSSGNLFTGHNADDVEIQAYIIQALLNQQTVQDINILFQSLYCALLIGIFYFILSLLRLHFAFLTGIGLAIVQIIIGYILNHNGYRMMLLTPVAFFAISIILNILERYLLSLLEKKHIERTLKMYVDTQVVDAIAEKSVDELKNTSQHRDIAVLFVDIRGFTSISESLEPEQVVEILNEYLSLVAHAINKWGGTLDKFIGDAAMAIFNAPNDLDNYELRAVCAAKEISESADYIQKKFMEKYHKSVSFGIGVNCGGAVVGNIGCESRMDYTAIGDTVNIAARLEAAAAPGQILITETVYERIQESVKTSFMGSMQFKGKTKEIPVYQVNQITGSRLPQTNT